MPSKRELGLVQSLVFLYDAYVYNSFLQLYTVDYFDKQTFNIVNGISDTLMKWLQNYKDWCAGMTNLQDCYMKPLVDQLSKSESAKAELADFKLRVSRARATLSKPTMIAANYQDARIVDQLHLSGKRPGADMSSKRSRARYKREHTL